MDSPSNYQCFVFDFFGVICSEVAPFWLSKYLPLPEAQAVKDTVVESADRGTLSQDALFSTLAELTHKAPTEVEQEWLSYARIDLRIVDLIRTARQTRKIGLLSNSPSRFIRGILREHNLTNCFDAIVISSEHGCAKPDAEIYFRVINELSATAGDVLLIDDNPRNVAGATAVGMRGLLFRSFEQLNSVLFA